MSAQFFEEWNKIFEFKLRESDLQNPTELILTSALSNYLEHLNINVNRMREDNMDSEESQCRFKAEFCAYIDHILKALKPQDQFLYYDLIQPTSKKTMYILKMLLNFYHYYNVMKIQVEEESNDVASSFETALVERNKCQRENQMAQERVDRMKAELSHLANILPQMQKNDTMLKSNIASIDVQIANLQAKLSASKLTSIELQQDLQGLRNKLVSSEQVQSVKDTLTELDKEFNELAEYERNTQATIKELSEKIDTAGTADCLAKFLETNTVADATSEIVLRHKNKRIEQDILAASATRAQLQAKLVAKSNELKTIKAEYDQALSVKTQTNVTSMRELSDLELRKEELQEMQKKLSERLERTDAQVQKLEQQHGYIVRESGALLGSMRSSIK